MNFRTLGAQARLVGGMVIALGGLHLAGRAEAVEARVPAFKQAVAEAAADDRDIAAFYRTNEYSPVWTGLSDEDRARRSALFSMMETAGLHGLPADRYDRDRLMDILASVRSPRGRGFAEVAMTKAFIRLARDLHSGVLEPSSVDDGIKRERVQRDAATHLTGITETPPRAYFRKIVPQTREYVHLMKEKLRLEQLIEDGGWGAAVPAGVLGYGDSGEAVVALRDRLMRMGYLGRTSTLVYDRNIEQAVRRFQDEHGLEADGKAGASTIAEINKPAEHRLRSVIVAMERERWLNTERGDRHIMVNLTDFSVRIIDDGRISFQTRAVVGANTHDRRSPEFSDVMEHLIINPTWNVPRSITVKEYLPQLQANPRAVSHLKLYNGSGRQVSRAGINFSAYNARTFPFDLKEPPSPGNALGRVKFMFPNRYNIYLHDTPSKHLFKRARRAYSHGCVRLADPFDFAYEILSRQEKNPRDAFHRILDTGRETQVDLDQKIPVHIIYRTAFTDARGRVQYREDVYGRDARIWNALARLGTPSEAVVATTWEPQAAQPSRTPRAQSGRSGGRATPARARAQQASSRPEATSRNTSQTAASRGRARRDR